MLFMRESFKKNYTQKLVDHADVNFTAITGRKKACWKNTPKIKLKKKRRRKSDTKNAVMTEAEIAEVKTRQLELQPRRTFAENVDDLPWGCDWGGKRDRTSYWCGYLVTWGWQSPIGGNFNFAIIA